LTGATEAGQARRPPGRRSVYLFGLGLGLAAVAAAATGAWYGGIFDRLDHPKTDAPAAAAAPAANPDSRSPEWFARYRDRFLSGVVLRYANDTATARNFPTVKGTMTVGTVPAGRIVAGRLVAGGDEGTTWLKRDDGSFIPLTELAERPRLQLGPDGSMLPAVSNVQFGTTLVNNLISDVSGDHVFRANPTDVVVQFNYNGGVLGTQYACELRDGSGNVATALSFYFITDSGGFWCRFGNVNGIGNYDVVLAVGGSQKWLGDFRIAPGE
jgi:hypothetical protein